LGKIKFVYPNVSGIQQRGGLLKRWELTELYIVIPSPPSQPF